MSHEIERDRFFCVGNPAWHEIQEPWTDAPTPEQAKARVYPESLHKVPLEAYTLDAEGNKHYTDVSTHDAIFRSDGKLISVMPKTYNLQQADEPLNFINPFIEAGLVQLESGASLFDGKRVFYLAKILGATDEISLNDAIESYLLCATSFDGSLSNINKIVNTRVVCWNTLSMALGETGAIGFKTRHTKNMAEKIQIAQTAIGEALQGTQRTREAYKQLARKKMSAPQMVTYVKEVINVDKQPEDQWSGPMQTKVNLVIDLLESQRGFDQLPAIHGTAWQAYNAVSEYVTHHASRNVNNRINNQYFDGPTAKLNSRALAMALAA